MLRKEKVASSILAGTNSRFLFEFQDFKQKQSSNQHETYRAHSGHSTLSSTDFRIADEHALARWFLWQTYMRIVSVLYFFIIFTCFIFLIHFFCKICYSFKSTFYFWICMITCYYHCWCIIVHIFNMSATRCSIN